MQNLNVVKSYLKRELSKVIKGIEIGNAYSFKGNAVVVIPMQLNGWWYGTVQIQGNHYKAQLSKIAKNSHISTFVSQLDTMNSDSLKGVTSMLKDFIKANI